MQHPLWPSNSAKRARVEQSSERADHEDDPIDIDFDVFCVESPARSMSIGLESTVMIAREVLLSLDPAEKGIPSLPREGVQVQLSQKNNMGLDFTPERQGDSAPTWYSTSSPVSSVQPAPNTTQNDSSSREYVPSTLQTPSLSHEVFIHQK